MRLTLKYKTWRFLTPDEGFWLNSLPKCIVYPTVVPFIIMLILCNILQFWGFLFAGPSDFGPDIHDDFPAVFPQQPLVGQEMRVECLAYGRSELSI
jgi:hypothetical protein